MTSRTDTLGHKVAQSAMGAFGAAEHQQIAGLIRGAKHFVLDRDAAVAVQKTLNVHTWSVESNLDLLEFPEEPTWFEWPLPCRSGRGGGDEARTGCLIAPHPDLAGLYIVVTGWDTGEVVGHAYGVALLNGAELADEAYLARNQYTRTTADSLTRIMSNVHAFIPSAFHDELRIITDSDADVMDAALRDATSELPFMLATLLAIKAVDGLIEDKTDEWSTRLRLREPHEAGFITRIATRLLRKTVGAFDRRRDKVTWIRN